MSFDFIITILFLSKQRILGDEQLLKALFSHCPNWKVFNPKMKLLKLIILLLMCLLIDGEEANNQNIGINGLR